MCRILVAVLTLLALAPSGRAAIITPAGLNPGDRFRIVFVSEGTTPATSSDLAVYDSIVRVEAAAANLESYEGSPVTWQAIVSSPDTNAVTRLPRDDVPLYLPHVPTTTLPLTRRVAAGGAQLWATESVELLHTINMWANGIEVQVGGVSEPVWVWTGATPDGTTDLAGSAMGSSGGRSLVGLAGARDGNWVNATADFQAAERPVYGFSEVLVVRTGSFAPVPEPGTLVLALVGLGGLAGARLFRRGRDASPPPATSRQADS